MTLEERFYGWVKGHQQKCMEKDLGKREARLLQRLLVSRFGALAGDVPGRISLQLQTNRNVDWTGCLTEIRVALIFLFL